MKSDFGHIVIVPKHVCQSSWWATAPRDGFTIFCSQQMNVVVPVDDVTDRETQVIVKRQHVLATLIGLHQAKVNAGIKHAVERRN